MHRVHTICQMADVGPVVWAVPHGDRLATECTEMGMLHVEGSETDVLSRMRLAMRASGARHAVRITADCPLHNPRIIRWMVQDHLQAHRDFTSNCREPDRWPDGLDTEIMSLPMLDYLNLSREPRHREHVTLEAYERWDTISKRYIMGWVPWTLSMGQKWSLDTEDDLERIRAHVAKQG